MYSATAALPQFPEGPPRDWPGRDDSALVACAGLQWYVRRSGQSPAHAPTILLLHGTGGSTHSWAEVIPLLAPHAHVVAVDLPGHGFTYVPDHVARARHPYTLRGMSRLLQQLCEALAIQPATIAGHSAGCAVALRMALEGPVRPTRVVGLCPALLAPPSWYVALVAPLLGHVVERAAVANGAARLAARSMVVERLLAGTGTPLTAAQAARYRLLCTKPAHVHAALTMMARWDLPALLREAGALQVPTHLVLARDDRWLPLAPLTRAVQGIPRLTMTVEAGGHLLPEERPEVVAQAIRGPDDRATPAEK